MVFVFKYVRLVNIILGKVLKSFLYPLRSSKFPDWKKRRDEFYGIKDTENVSIEKLLTFYEAFFKKMRLKVIFSINVVRVLFEEIDTNHYFAFYLER